MADIKVPRRGSMQFYPRKRARRHFARVRSRIAGEGVCEFAGYKAGMTTVMITDNKPTSPTKGDEIAVPATIIECPPLKVVAIRAYNNKKALAEVRAEQFDKNLSRRIPEAKKRKETEIKDYDRLTLIVHTQPALTSVGKKKPDLFEVEFGTDLGKAKDLLGKEIPISSVFKEGQLIDVHSITKGKGYQGPVKRFGVSLRSHKSEKTKRGPGSLGGWKGQAHVMYRVAHAGQMGYHQRKDLNKWIIQIGTDPKKVNPKGGLLRYGLVKGQYMLLKGSIPGPAKRLIRMTKASRPDRNTPTEGPSVEYISLESRQ